jgi:hypothetical protein
VKTPYPENNLVNARWFPARGKPRRRSVAALERRCHRLQQLLQSAQHAGHCGASAEHAVSRYPHAVAEISDAPIMPFPPTLAARSMQCGRA